MTSNSGPVLIVGAGPVGLTMACELVRHGVACRIIDKASERSQTSKALAIFPRTLEVFETMGVVDQVLGAGKRLRGLCFHDHRHQIARVDLSSVASPYPFVISLPQSETERILIEKLQTLGVTIERERELTGLAQSDGAVTARVRSTSSSTSEETIEAPWLVGCDGAHSATRHALGLGFDGAPYEENFVLADVTVESSLSKDEVHLFFSRDGIFAVICFAPDRSRVIANVPTEYRDQNSPPPTIEEIQRLAELRGPPGLKITNPVWLSRFHISHRKVEEFRRLRAFLAGDAAHIHSPAGGQGMNTGIQDAFNLAWKLALVVRGRSPAFVLASYDVERQPVARGVLNLTDRMTRIATVRNPIAQTVRNILLPVASGVDFLEGKIADRLAELNVNYRRSPLVENHGAGGLRAGDRAPDCELRDENGRACRLFELFRQPRHVLLVFLGPFDQPTGENGASIPGLAGDLMTTYRVGRGPGSGGVGDLRDSSGVAHSLYQMHQGGMVLVRPDGYIGFRSDQLSFETLRNYLGKLFSG